MSRPLAQLAFIGAVICLSDPVLAGGIELCNKSSTKLRSAVVIKEGFGYLSDTWSSIGYYHLDKGECTKIGGGGWGGSRAWGYVSVEREISETEIENLRTLRKKLFERRESQKKLVEIQQVAIRKQTALSNFYFYDHLVKYLPGSRQAQVAVAFDADMAEIRNRPLPAMPRFDEEKWDPYIMVERQDVIDDQGFSGSNYKTCLPPGGFNFTTTGAPARRESCAASERLVPFSVEVWVLPDSRLVLNATDKGIESSLRTRR